MVQNLPLQLFDAPPASVDRHRARDLRTLARFVSIYCADHHAAETELVTLKGLDLTAVAGRDVALCPGCAKLLAHAVTKRTHCPMNPKPACKRCPQHCYHPAYREQIQRIMRYSGRKLLLSGRIDYLVRMLF